MAERLVASDPTQYTQIKVDWDRFPGRTLVDSIFEIMSRIVSDATPK